MGDDLSQPGTPPGGPLQAMTPERANMQRDSLFSSLQIEKRDSSVHDKINQFNTLSQTMQSKHLERKTADAALKRAMLGREEAEAEMRRYREEARSLRKAIEEGKERERRVGERLETVMENYGRAKETHAHTQALWEKEIRRARKETFKTQSTIVKVQEELKSARTTVKSLEESLEHEKERSRVREQEAFSARYSIVGVQEQLEQALERIKLVEQERDAYKTAAKNEEVARIAAEGRIPLPAAESPDDEFASPRKTKRKRLSTEGRVSLSTMEIVSSVATELEIEELSLQIQWERQRADRAQEMVEFLRAECEMHCCQCSKSKPKPQSSTVATQTEVFETEEEVDSTNDAAHEAQPSEETPFDPQATVIRVEERTTELAVPKPRNGPRLSTIFCPREGIFRTVSEMEAEALEAQSKAEAEMNVDQPAELSVKTERLAEPARSDELPSPEEPPEGHGRMYARTPSVEPPSFALLAQDRVSLLSLLNAPHNNAQPSSIITIPTQPDETVRAKNKEPTPSPELRPHTSTASYATSTASYSTATTTTSVPIHDDNYRPDSSFSEKLRTPSSGSQASFDLTNPALTPTMTREQALAKIRERRGRARSIAQSAAASHKKMLDKNSDRRHMSAPTRATSVKRRS
ncbi:hypothetical protein B0I35DRAFT_229019 [Stachybotrys elegans]|uniref:Uncharacterized protein n=1 Tax=Stachybotrys elegans TaxID=80388 RepID=A0A8K0SWI0_9HYPO|nr:hypothetical protein B0I35DRAFT_229019 [Stachybotrys elegans]